MKKVLKKFHKSEKSMTSTVLQQPQAVHHKEWTIDRIRLSIKLPTTASSPLTKDKKLKRNRSPPSADDQSTKNMANSDSNGLKKAFMKLLVFEGSSNSKNNNNTLANFLTSPTNNDGDSKAKMSLLKFFAINALELTAPASPVILEQTNNTIPTPSGWLQLSGHPKSIAPAANGIVQKRVASSTDSEVIAYRGIIRDPHACSVVPKFLGVREINNESYIELEDLLYGFKDPNVMDIKMGCRTFLESEVSTKSLRPDLYQKMIAVDPTSPTPEEHEQKAITKLRYMMFREQLSSSQTKGFRIEALKMKGETPVTNLKTLRGGDEVGKTISQFVSRRGNVASELVKCLTEMRTKIERSTFFKQHEVIGSSVFIVYDEDKVGAWLIDFAKCRKLPEGVTVDHRRAWQPGNFEEGLLHGMDELIKTFATVSQP